MPHESNPPAPESATPTVSEARELAVEWLRIDPCDESCGRECSAAASRERLFAWVRTSTATVRHRGSTDYRHRWDQVEFIAELTGIPVQGPCECGQNADRPTDEDGCCPSCGCDLFHDEDGNPSGPAWALCEAASDSRVEPDIVAAGTSRARPWYEPTRVVSGARLPIGEFTFAEFAALIADLNRVASVDDGRIKIGGLQ